MTDTFTPITAPGSQTTPQFEIRQRRAGGTFHVYLLADKREVFPPEGSHWSQADAKREGNRLIAPRQSTSVTCPVCKKFVGGDLIRCTCPVNSFAGKSAIELVAEVRRIAKETETRIRNVAGTAQLDRLERKDLAFARDDLRTIQVALAELDAFLSEGAPAELETRARMVPSLVASAAV